ncbi:MAG: HlyD family efflux transporter periplasmic adaptor subunit [Oscillibacter sp.]|nr:HlyD family efflux transporter periplasmic adaptor subunit [Oscillibacter sp.]
MADHTYDSNPETGFPPAPPEGPDLPSEEEYLRSVLDGVDAAFGPGGPNIVNGGPSDSGTGDAAGTSDAAPASGGGKAPSRLQKFTLKKPNLWSFGRKSPLPSDGAEPDSSPKSYGTAEPLSAAGPGDTAAPLEPVGGTAGPAGAAGPKNATATAAPKGAAAPAGPGVPAEAKKKKSAAERKKRRRTIRIIVGILIALLVIFFLWRHFHGGGGSASTEVLTDFVQYGSIMSTVEGSGLTRARNSETVLIPYAGTVREVLVEEGDVVSAGDPLFVVDSEDARKAVEDAEKNVDKANEAVDRANEAVQTARDRVREAEQGITTAQDRVREAQESVTTAQDRVRDAEEGVTSARKRVDTAVKSLNEVREKLNKLDIRAEYDGKLLDVQKLEPGDSVSEGTVIATLADDTRMRLTLYYSYAYAEDLREGQAMTVSIPRLMSEVSGVVEKIKPVERITEEGSRLFAAEISAVNEGGLTEGMEATAYTVIDGEDVYPYESGKLEYYRKSEVKAEVTGKVIASMLDDYLPVNEGQILLTLDDEDLQEKISDAEKAVEDAEKDVESARERVTEAEKGVESARKNVTDQQKGVEDARKNVADQEKGVEDALKNVEEQKQGVEDALKKLDEARENAEKCNGTAGIDGKVIGLDLLVGEEVPAGKAAMAISDTSTIVVNATVDERNISYVKKGMTVDLDQWGMPAMGIIDSVSLSSTVNNGVATYPMIISVDNADESIQVNSNINYKLVASQNDNCLVVPIQSVRTVTTEDGENKTVVYVQANLAPEGVVEGVYADEEIPEGFWPVEVQTGIQDTYNVEIRSGLEEGWEIFTQIQSDQPW